MALLSRTSVGLLFLGLLCVSSAYETQLALRSERGARQHSEELAMEGQLHLLMQAMAGGSAEGEAQEGGLLGVPDAFAAEHHPSRQLLWSWKKAKAKAKKVRGGVSKGLRGARNIGRKLRNALLRAFPAPPPPVLRGVRNVSLSSLKPQVPFHAKEFGGGFFTGILLTFGDAYRSSESFNETKTILQSCFDPRRLHAQFLGQDVLRPSNVTAGISDVLEFAKQASTERKNDVRRIYRILRELDGKSRRALKAFTTQLRKLAPLVLSFIRHMIDCGPLDPLLGMLIMWIAGMFPPLLFILVPVGLALFAVELWNHMTRMIKAYGKNWFRFGKHFGALAAYLGSAFLAYKQAKKANGSAGDRKHLKCKKGNDCHFIPEKDATPDGLKKDRYWSRKKKVNGNRVFQRDDLIDPRLVDNKGRTNLQRMKRGLAPLGPDRKPLNLHHVSQKQHGAIAEVTDSFHKQYHGSLHDKLGKGTSTIDRGAFDSWRGRYWRQRGKEITAVLEANGSFGADGRVRRVPWRLLRRGAKSVDSFIDNLLSKATGDMGRFNIVRILLEVLREPAKRLAADTEEQIKDAATGEIAGCLFDPECTTPIAAHAGYTGEAEVGKGRTKRFRFTPPSDVRRSGQIHIVSNSIDNTIKVVVRNADVDEKEIYSASLAPGEELKYVISGCRDPGTHSIDVAWAGGDPTAEFALTLSYINRAASYCPLSVRGRSALANAGRSVAEALPTWGAALVAVGIAMVVAAVAVVVVVVVRRRKGRGDEGEVVDHSYERL